MIHSNQMWEIPEKGYSAWPTDARVLFGQTDTRSYRDPAAFIKDGVIYLFFTLIEDTQEGQFFYIAESISRDFIHWSAPVILTKKDVRINNSSPGNVIFRDEWYYLCVQTYPRPNGETYGNEDSRVFTMRSSDLLRWEPPELLAVKGDIPVADMGRMIDPFILEDGGGYRCFFKQNGVSFSTSPDLKHWTFQGSTACGENVCVLKQQDEYLIFHSPRNGIGLLKTKDFRHFTDCGITTLGQARWGWARDRVTAGFVLPLPERYPYRFALFFHGDNEEKRLFGASLAMLFFNNVDDLFSFDFSEHSTGKNENCADDLRRQ